jgi:hypothetical protein
VNDDEAPNLIEVRHAFVSPSSWVGTSTTLNNRICQKMIGFAVICGRPEADAIHFHNVSWDAAA